MKHTRALLLISLFLTMTFLTACTNTATTTGAPTASKNKEIARMANISLKHAIYFEYPKSPNFAYTSKEGEFTLTKTSETEKYELIGRLQDFSRNHYEERMKDAKKRDEGFIEFDINGEKGYSVRDGFKKERTIYIPLKHPEQFVMLMLELEKKDADFEDDVTPIFESKEFKDILNSMRFDEKSPELAATKDKVYSFSKNIYINNFAAPEGAGYTVNMKPINAGILAQYETEGKDLPYMEVSLTKTNNTISELMAEYKKSAEKPDRPINYQDKVYGGITFKDTSLFGEKSPSRNGFFEKDGRIFRYSLDTQNNEALTKELVESVLKNLNINEKNTQ